MKIFTNVQTRKLGGITHTVSSFIDFIQAKEHGNVSVTGITVARSPQESTVVQDVSTRFRLVSTTLDLPGLSAITGKVVTVEELRAFYDPIISAYVRHIEQEQPTIVLINGTHHLAWCLLQAACTTNIPAAIHYHGVLTKEIEDWSPQLQRIFRSMERAFSYPDVHYIFPSVLSKQTVEQEIFGHQITNFTILPNSVPLIFFQANLARHNTNHLGIVGRWEQIKNIAFTEKFALYNRDMGKQFVINAVTDLDAEHDTRKRLSHDINFHMPMDRDHLAKFYTRMGVVLSPSRFETYGNVAMEALASGTPALVNANMGVAETFRQLGLSDWIISYDLVSDVYERVRQVTGMSVSPEVRAAIQANYTPEVIHQKLLDLLISLTKNQP